LLPNHGRWCAQNSESDSPNSTLWTLLELHRKQFGRIFVRGLSTELNADAQIDAHIAALSVGVAAPHEQPRAKLAWLEFALNPFPELFAGPPDGVSVKVKDALLKKPLTDSQIRVAYRYLTRDDYDVMGGMLGFATYGGRINCRDAGATASAQRSAILDMACNTGWIEPKDATRIWCGCARFIVSCSPTPAASRRRTTRTTAHSSIIPTSISPILR
jgi:aclacinomycin oxidase